ncbi:hypothetical protein UA08_03238 [Talaromyces atroroseus]|uniref:D-xylose 1-dehydrogenase (NADP(+), D-xylono-1,5-lactone-forming) n=1 Tax=Talaromyces atroroseus TaxID=1441469 RepID=A0A225B280_TALAT|nr:hypothetical protein UA08_03238 [Talaromyces atroroseus]OKL61346.1 hypothetical protein UA08_03238 [Talaromyces atroroseus]
MIGFLHRLYAGFISPPEAPKTDSALRFGLLGASFIAPMALILPAKSHPEVIVACVAARDRVKAEKYAKEHGIPVVHDTYEDVINDPAVSCIYIALPNSHHYEWALRAVKAGKHVLLEKPSTSNASEAKKLFGNHLFAAPGAPVLLEAFHYSFHPAWQIFLQLIHQDPLAGPVKIAYSQFFLYKGFLNRNDPSEIRLRYALAGGCGMDLSSYNVSHIRQMLADSHPNVQSANFRMLSTSKPPLDEQDLKQIDEAVTATFKSATGAEGRIVADLSTAGGWPIIPASWSRNLPSIGWPKCVAELGEKQIEDDTELTDGETHVVQRTVTFYNHIAPSMYHSIVVQDKHSIKRDVETVHSWTQTRTVKAYDWPDKSDGRQGESWWTTYRYQLNEFVHHVKGRKGSGVWFSGQDSIDQMAVIDEMYEKGGLKARPSAAFESEP